MMKKLFMLRRNVNGKIVLLIVAILLLLGSGATAHAESPDLKFERITTQQGLSQSTVYAILQDSKGFMWFGTEDGLNKYDGYNFTVYRFDQNDPSSLGGNKIQAIHEDKEGQLWIGTVGGGLNKFNRNKERFTRYQSDPKNPQSLSSNEVVSIYEDKNGIFWLGTWKGGLNKFDKKTGQFTSYQHDDKNPDSIAFNDVYTIYEDSGRRLTNLVNDILDFSKLKHQKLELDFKPVDMREVVNIVLTLCKPLVAKKPLLLKNNISAEFPMALADENRLQQIMHNLIGNAIKFTEIGEVTVDAKADDTASIMEISVTDTGMGIPEDKLEVIFESFQQVDASITRVYSGTGLGLSVTHLRLAKINTAYSRFVPREFLRFLNKESIIDVKLGDQIQKEMTILFSDIRSFTTLSEQMTPQENFNFLNSYLKNVSPVIRQHNGFIDKYIGDAIMALFPGTPDEAIRAAIAMQKKVAEYNIRRQHDGRQSISIGIGLHTGAVMLGTVGEDERMEGTVISDVVNLAARLEGLTKLYGAYIVVSEQTLFGLDRPNQYKFRFLDKVIVKGKKDPVSVFEIFDGNAEEVTALKLETQTDFEKGLLHYYSEEFAEAEKCFTVVLAISPQDKAAQIYLWRVKHFIEYGVPMDWEGIEALTEK